MKRVSSLLLLCGLLGACSPNPTPGAVSVPPDTSPAGSSSSPAVVASTKPPPAPSGAKTLWVAEHMVDCEGEGPMRCLRVRDSAQGEWQLFYSPIEGFTHEDSFAYELRVQVEAKAAPPMDGSAKRYRLLEVVSKKKVTPLERFSSGLGKQPG